MNSQRRVNGHAGAAIASRRPAGDLSCPALHGAAPEAGFRPPAPIPPAAKPSLLARWWIARRCLLSAFPERNYSMKMGELRLPWSRIYSVCEPALVRRILVEQAERFPKSSALRRVLKALIGDGVVISDGELWQRQRRMIDPAFGQARLQTVFPLMRQAVEAMCERFDAFAEGHAPAIDVETTHVTADIIFRTIFSTPLDQRDAAAVFHAFVDFQRAATVLWMSSVAGLPIRFSWRRLQAASAARRIRGRLEPLVRRRFERQRRGEALEEQDILSALIAARDPETGHVFTLAELIDQVATLFLGGHETTASALAWALYLCAMQPAVQERLHAEAMGVLGERPPEFSDIKQLKFTRDVFRETLRLYPPFGFIAREAAHTEEMRDKVVPAGSPIAIVPWLIHRHRRLWDRPDVFDPDRFQTESAKESLRSAYLPFSLGPRVCLGAAFAMQEAPLILASLMRRYRFEPLAGHTPRPVGRLTIRSENGIRLGIHKRLPPPERARSAAERGRVGV